MRGVYDAYFNSCVWSLGAVRTQTTFDIDKAMTFETKKKAEIFRDDNLDGAWYAIPKVN